jgi:serine protease Do
MKFLSTSMYRSRRSTLARSSGAAIAALLAIAVLVAAVGLVGSARRSRQSKERALSSGGLAGMFASTNEAVRDEPSDLNGRFDSAPPSDADAVLSAALERLERQVASAMAHARESVVALEYTAADAPAGTRRIATGIVINQRGDVLSVKIDPLASGEPSHSGKSTTPILARDYLRRRHVAQWIAGDPETGLTLLRVSPDAVRPIRMATGGANLGGQVFVLGNPFGMGHSISRGHIAGLDWAMELGERELGGLIQVQAPLYPGDSGAAVVNVRGDLLGLVRSSLAVPSPRAAIGPASRRLAGGAPSSATGEPRSWTLAGASADALDRAERDNDFGFAIPARDALWVADQLSAHGRVDRAYLGVRLEEASDNLSVASSQAAILPKRVPPDSENGLPASALDSPADQRPELNEGAVLSEVLAGTPAAESGLRKGDCIVSVNGGAIRSAHDLTDRLDRILARAIIQLGVLRGPGSEREKIVLSLCTASRPTRRQITQLGPATPQPATAPSGISTSTAPVTATRTSSPPAATVAAPSQNATPAKHALLSTPSALDHAQLAERSAALAPGLRPNDLRLTLPKVVTERLEQLEHRLEKLESPSTAVKALSSKDDHQVGSIRNP